MRARDARVKILIFFLLIVCSVTTPPDAQRVFVGYFLLVTVLVLVSGVTWRELGKRLGVLLPLLAVILAGPLLQLWLSTHDGKAIPPAELSLLGAVVAKALLSLVALTVLFLTTGFEPLMQGFEGLGVPSGVTRLARVTYRYLFVLGNEAQRLWQAAVARGFGARWLWQARVVGQLVGTLFLRSYERGERVHLAMLARGLGERRTQGRKPRPDRLDLIFGLVLGAAIWGLRLLP